MIPTLRSFDGHAEASRQHSQTTDVTAVVGIQHFSGGFTREISVERLWKLLQPAVQWILRYCWLFLKSIPIGQRSSTKRNKRVEVAAEILQKPTLTKRRTARDLQKLKPANQRLSELRNLLKHNRRAEVRNKKTKLTAQRPKHKERNLKVSV